MYSLAPTQTHGEHNEETQSDIAATLIRVRIAIKRYLNLYENHFSYIKDLARYSRSFCCSHDGKYWKKGSRFSRHEKTCDGKVQLKYPGGE